MPEQRFRIAPTGRGAIFRAKRWFYATFYSSASEDVKEENKKAWTAVATKLVEEMNKRNASDMPTRITLKYETGINGEFKPISATVELMELKPVGSFTVHFSPEAESKGAQPGGREKS